MTLVRQASLYGITLEQLKDLTKHHGQEGIDRINYFGGIEAICKMLHTSTNEGLSGQLEDLKHRREIFGTNLIPQKKTKSFLKLVWEALQNVTLIILDVAALISIGLYFYKKLCLQDVKEEESNENSWIEGAGILISVVVVVIVTAFNDYSKEKQFQSLKKQINKESKFSVIRKGETNQINVNEIVVGDICSVKYGDLLPADGILIQSNDLKVDQSSLTGESEYVKKGKIIDPMLFSGTHVMEGSGKMLVTAVGINSQAGIIYTLLGVVGNKKNVTIKNNLINTNTQQRNVNFLKRNSVTETSKDNNVPKPAKKRPKQRGESFETEKIEKSILQEKLTKLAICIGYIGTVIAIFTVIVLTVQFCIHRFVIEHQSWNNAYINYFNSYLIIGVTILVVAIPEGLPLAVTLSLAYSVKKMMKDNNLVRHLNACETMGNVTTICSDKTGTLTANKMTVVQAYICEALHKTIPKFSSIPLDVGNLIIQAISINSSYTSRIIPPNITGEQAKPVGNKTECALLEFLLALGQNYQTIRDEYPEHTFTRVYTFNSNRKSMSTVVSKKSGGYQLFTKGASEVLLNKCAFIYGEYGFVKQFTVEMQTDLERTVIVNMARDGLRTITIAHREFVFKETDINQVKIKSEPNWDDEDDICNNLTFLCVVGIEDPVRPEVPEAIRKCQIAGITVRMVTGDNINTAKSIALKCGILKEHSIDAIMEGREFNKRITDANGEIQQHLLDNVWPKLLVLARSSPMDKYVLVKGIINSKITDDREVVAVTGDGTNDGPALRKADVGFSMGIVGTDVAKEASDIIITDDNFTSIVKAVIWGRNIYDSIAKFLQFQLTVNLTAIIITLVGACTVDDIPLKPVQMLWVNLIMDSLASLALATEVPTEALLLRKPYGSTKPLISQTMMKNIVGHSLYQLSIVFTLLFYGDKILGIPSGRGVAYGSLPTEHFTVIFNTFVLMTLFNEINARKIHNERNIFKGVFTNTSFIIIWFGTVVLHIIIVQFGGQVMSTHKLDLDHWLWCIFLGIGTLIWGQLITTIPTNKTPEKCSWFEGNVDKCLNSIKVGKKQKTDSRSTILWMRGHKRIRQQLSVIRAFRSSVDCKEGKSLKYLIKKHSSLPNTSATTD